MGCLEAHSLKNAQLKSRLLCTQQLFYLYKRKYRCDTLSITLSTLISIENVKKKTWSGIRLEMKQHHVYPINVLRNECLKQWNKLLLKKYGVISPILINLSCQSTKHFVAVLVLSIISHACVHEANKTGTHLLKNCSIALLDV